MNGHDTYFELITWDNQEKQFDENGDEVEVEETENE